MMSFKQDPESSDEELHVNCAKQIVYKSISGLSVRHGDSLQRSAWLFVVSLSIYLCCLIVNM